MMCYNVVYVLVNFLIPKAYNKEELTIIVQPVLYLVILLSSEPSFPFLEVVLQHISSNVS